MKYTLLDMVQTILSSMDSDEVNSITDTTEALQVAYTIRSVYYRIAASADLPEQSGLFNLTASGASTPVVMYRPSNVNSIEWVKYNWADLTATEPQFKEVKFMPLSNFLAVMFSLNTDETDVDSFDLTVNGADTFKVIYRNNAFPTYYTVLDDNTVLFDSFNSEVESSLQSSKTICQGLFSQIFYLTDNFTPNLDEQQFDLLLNESKSWCFAEMKQSVNQKAEQAARRGWIGLQRTKHAFPNENVLPDYGRRKP